MRISGKLITSPDPAHGNDGLGLSDGQHHEIGDCIIDLSGWPLSKLDEAVGVTWGSSAVFRRCVIRGAGKLILCGCGDDPDNPDNATNRDRILAERGKRVVFDHCILEDFGRRGPEVQGGMECILDRCLIRNWGVPDRFDVRDFGAWAHHGGYIHARNCIFHQRRVLHGLVLFVRDIAAHIGQAWNDEGLLGILSGKTYIPGQLRALTATAGGRVDAFNCWDDCGLVRIENHLSPMSTEEMTGLWMELEAMKIRLETELGC